MKIVIENIAIENIDISRSNEFDYIENKMTVTYKITNKDISTTRTDTFENADLSNIRDKIHEKVKELINEDLEKLKSITETVTLYGEGWDETR